eukprot:4658488-Pyramimonas_sp.AAC.1
MSMPRRCQPRPAWPHARSRSSVSISQLPLDWHDGDWLVSEWMDASRRLCSRHGGVRMKGH